MYTSAYSLTFALSSAVLLAVLGILGYLLWGVAGALLVPGIPAAVVLKRLYSR